MDTFISSLKIMGLGMLGIFIFMLLFGVVIYALHKIFPGTTEEK
ncbi:MAG: hypothetical protein PHT64_01090 [Bacteroidales bacterium]|nr:hypothetical protein [Bacteroidales bacterium]MDD4031289.1 hypothetical protein [Bacteroidales bacterium]MDD4435388.1 hypothetical protein [Bacteroidales bacterium]MDD5732375.1 hypothetical protein [Bacteroidales bacterium]